MKNTLYSALISVCFVNTLHAATNPPEGHIFDKAEIKNGKEVHTYIKPGPAIASPQRTVEDVRDLYVQALPEDQRQIGENYLTLLDSQQNLQLELKIATLRHQKLKMDVDNEELENRLGKKEAAGADGTVNEIVSDAFPSTSQVTKSAQNDSNEISPSEYLSAIQYQGKFNRGKTYYVQLRLPTGESIYAIDGAIVGKGVKVSIKDNIIELEKEGELVTLIIA